jgi:tape measure domain-containing protein
MEGGDHFMSSIDERVVEARFENKQFQTGVKDTLNSLDSLKKGMQLEGATKGLSGISAGVDKIAGKFSAMSVAGITALATLTNKAVDAGIRIGKAFTIDPVKAGFENYETQINAVQTILANTGLKGKKGMDQVNTSLNTLNDYANKTIYNFSEMARNIGTFTAAGVKLKPATDSIKGIANLAAMSGSNSQQASTAMYQLSQALAAGRVKLQDWNSVVNAGMGGKVFQKALFQTGQAMHTIKDAKVGETFEQWTKAGHTFRGSLQDGWVTSKVLTSTLQQFTGDLTDAQLKSMGFNKEQIKSIQEQAKVANDAATKIKTFHQMTQALREEVASAYAQMFKTLFGDINQAKGLFTPLHNVIQNALTNPLLHFNEILQGLGQNGRKICSP